MRRSLAVVPIALLAACGSSGIRGGWPLPPGGKKAGEPCVARAECQSGLICLSGACAAVPAADWCPTPPGTTAIADGGAVSSIDPDFCVSAVQAPSALFPPGMIEDLGTLAVGATPSFLVTTGTTSFVLFSQEADDSAADELVASGTTIPNAVVPTMLRSPGGTLYYDDLADWPAVRLGGHDYPDLGVLLADPGTQAVAGGFQVPNTSAALDRMLAAGQLDPGEWTFTVNDWAFSCPFSGCAGGNGAGRYRVHAVTKHEPLSSTGTLDVEVYLATDPTSVLSTAAVALAEPRVARFVRSLGHYLANGGLCLGAVRFHDLPPWARTKFAPNGGVNLTDPGPCGDLQQLFTTATVPSRAVHLFLADDLTFDSGSDAFTIVGMDGSIPGPSGFPGTIYGGAIVGLADFTYETAGGCSASAPDLARCGADRVAYISAHEIGHWLGLYHTTEAGGFFFDPVSDTARCPCASCAPTAAARNGCYEVAGSSGATVVMTADCTRSASCGGGRNLMFWLFGSGSTGELSADQGRIMRLNPAVR